MSSETRPHVVVMASAGTGKTYRLSSRYIQLLAAGVEPGKILATTFTRKAAGEICERVLKRLAGAAENENERADLSRATGLTLSEERCRDLVVRVSRTLHRLNIETIDSFFHRVLRSFALDLGVSPAWDIAEEESDQLSREEAVGLAVGEPGLEIPHLFTLLRMLSRGKLGPAVHGAILRTVKSSYGAFVQARGKAAAWEFFGPAREMARREEIESIVSELRSLALPTKKDGSTRVRWMSAVADVIDAIERKDWKGVLATGLVGCVVHEGAEFDSVPIPDAVFRCLRRVFDEASQGALAEFRDRNIAVRDLMARFDEAYTALKARRGQLGFDDVPRTLLDAGAAGRLEDMYFRLDGQIDHLLLDEFQDTSLDQFEILKPMLEELLSTGDDSRSVLCVGDIKQSLYSWRGAEPELLAALPRRWEQFVPESLKESWRSSPCVLDAVNTVFEGLAANSALARFRAAERWAAAYEEHSAVKTELPGRVRLVLGPQLEEPPSHDDDDADSEEPVDLITHRARFIATRVEGIRREAPAATIGVLTRTNRPIPRIIFELHQLKIDAAGERGNPLTDSSAAASAVSALLLADHPGDSAAFYHVATSLLGRVLGVRWADDVKERCRDAAQVAARLRARIVREGIAGFLARIQRRMAGDMDDLSYARFDQLVDLAREFDDAGRGLGRPSEFARLVREQEVDPPRRGDIELRVVEPVRVMTVHKAKGLEFDAVVLVDLDKTWIVNPQSMLIDRRDENNEPSPLHEISAVTLYPSAALRAASEPLKGLFERTQDRVIGEELSGLYVGMTRARRCLEIIGFVEKSDGVPSAFKVLREGLAGGADLTQGAWECSSETAWFEGIERAGEAVERPSAEVQFATPKSVPSGRMRSRSPSSLEGDVRTPLGDLWRSGAGRAPMAKDRGTAFHAMFEAIEWLDEGAPRHETLCGALMRLGLTVNEDWVKGFCTHCEGARSDVLWKRRYAGRPGTLKVRREWRFAVREGDGMLTGQFDRVVIGMDGAQALWAEVVDFKTDAVETGDEALLGERVEHYRPQVEAYKRAAAALMGLRAASVTACLVFTEPGPVVAM